MTDLEFDQRGLIPAVAQDRLTGQIRMVAWMSREALERTLSSGFAWFYSRSRQALWEKGETSGNKLRVHAVYADCDADTLVLHVDPEGPSCHTGRPACFFRRVEKDGSVKDLEHEAEAFLSELDRELEARKSSTAQKSYTKSLLEGGPAKIGAKLREEAEELSRAVADESPERVASEAADLLYHLLVALRGRDVPLRTVIEVLAARAGVGGHEEKAKRRP